MKDKKIVVDTNVLLDHPDDALIDFEPKDKHTSHTLLLSAEVIGELDNFKREPGERGFCSRSVSRNIDQYIENHEGNLLTGIKVSPNYTIQGTFADTGKKRPEIDILGVSAVDKGLLRICLDYKDRGHDVELITNDTNVKNIAEIYGITAKKSSTRAHSSLDDIDAGWRRIELDDRRKDKFLNRQLSISDLAGLEMQVCNLLTENDADMFRADKTFDPDNINTNTYFSFIHPAHSDDRTNHKRWLLGKFSAKDKKILPINRKIPRETLCDDSFAPNNYQQALALDALFDMNIQFVTLLGFAGTGKTFLAIASALMQTHSKYGRQHNYRQVYIARPVIGAHKTVGFVPGNLKEKLKAWHTPIYDNISILTGIAPEDVHDFITGGFNKYENDHRHSRTTEKTGLNVEICSLEHIRGRSLGADIVIVDEAQNLTTEEAKTIITRAGDNTKIVFTGDPYQIDLKNVSRNRCGLVYASQKLSYLDITATIGFNIGERSRLATCAAKRL